MEVQNHFPCAHLSSLLLAIVRLKSEMWLPDLKLLQDLGPKETSVIYKLLTLGYYVTET